MLSLLEILARPYPAALFASTALCCVLALYSFRRRDVAAASWLAALMAAGAIWSGADLLQAASHDLDAKLLWARAAYLGIVSVPVVWLLFASSYAGEGSRPTRRALLCLLPIPALSLALTWSGGWHRLMWYPPELAIVDHGRPGGGLLAP